MPPAAPLVASRADRIAQPFERPFFLPVHTVPGFPSQISRLTRFHRDIQGREKPTIT
jgi:hypothetical protein